MSKRPERTLADVFAALGDRTRLALVDRLRREGPLSATSLSAGAGVTRQAISKHLQVLSAAGLVTQERRGREVLHALAPERLVPAGAYLDAISARWDRAVDRLRQLVEDPAPAASPRRRRP